MVIETNTEDNDRILIVGLGKTGLSCARHLVAQGYQVAIADSREQPPCLDELRDELPDVALFLGEFDTALFARAAKLVISPGVPVSLPPIQAAIAANVEVIGDVDLFAAAAHAPIIAITGSNAKSTVTTLVGLMARVSGLAVCVGGNLGEPMLNLLSADARLYVLELSSFQLETCHTLSPEVAIVLNISEDHMDRYSDLEDYATAKARILRTAKSGIYNLDDARVMAMPRTGQALFFTVAASSDAQVFCRREIDGSIWLCQGDVPLLDTSDMLLAGTHNHANALAALAIGTTVGLDMPSMLTAIRTFKGLPHRTEYIGVWENVRWYNDSKGTNPGATIAALQGMQEVNDSRTVLIAGGVCKQADFSRLGQVIEDCVRVLILLGRDRDAIREVTPVNVVILDAVDMAEAVELAASSVQAGDRVLLSPACASFDSYPNFEARGDDFSALVRRLMS